MKMKKGENDRQRDSNLRPSEQTVAHKPSRLRGLDVNAAQENVYKAIFISNFKITK
jgi:hypothetical protein